MKTQGQAYLLRLEGEFIHGVLLVAAKGKKKDWEWRTMEQFEEGAIEAGYDDALAFLFAFTRRWMLEHGVRDFETVVCNVLKSFSEHIVDQQRN